MIESRDATICSQYVCLYGAMCYYVDTVYKTSFIFIPIQTLSNVVQLKTQTVIILKDLP